MTRNGKIARLPKHIRDQLNQRLDNGEPGVRLLKWLNTLPEVEQVLDREFEGHPIEDANLTNWKQGGFLDWQAQQQMFSGAHDLTDDAKELSKLSDRLPQAVDTVVMARYAAALKNANGPMTDELRALWQQLNNSLRSVIYLRRCEHSRQRVEIQREQAQTEHERLALDRDWLEWEQSKFKIQNSKIPAQPPTPSPELSASSHEQVSQRIKQMVTDYQPPSLENPTPSLGVPPSGGHSSTNSTNS